MSVFKTIEGVLVPTSDEEECGMIGQYINARILVCRQADEVMEYFERVVDLNIRIEAEAQKYAECQNVEFNVVQKSMDQEYEPFLQVLWEEEFVLDNKRAFSRLTESIGQFRRVKTRRRKLCKLRYGVQLSGIAHNCEKDERADDATAMKIEQLKSRLKMYEEIIKQVGEEVVDFDDNENSSYMMYMRYMQIANQIHDEICHLQGSDPYEGITYFTRLDFCKSHFAEFNNALSNRFRIGRKQMFPSFYDVNKCLRKCAKKNDICRCECQLKAEIERCFKELLKLLKTRRGMDMDHILSAYLPNLNDPAMKDPALDRKLRQHLRIAKRRERQICDLYVRKQNAGVVPQLSAESDDSYTDWSSCDETVDMMI